MSCPLLAARICFFLHFPVFLVRYDQEAGTRRWPLWWPTLGGGGWMRSGPCPAVCARNSQSAKSRISLTHADGFKPHKSPCPQQYTFLWTPFWRCRNSLDSGQKDNRTGDTAWASMALQSCTVSLPLRISGGKQALSCLNFLGLSRSSLLTSHTKFRFHATASRLVRVFFLYV